MKRKTTAYVLENDVRHARLLPTASAHAFSYRTLSLLLPLSALENHQLDLGGGWLFGYDDRAFFSLVGLRLQAYLSTASEKGSLRAKLEEVLERFGHDSSLLQDAWMLTMPRYMGFEGINPLTVYYCYARESDSLWITVLEVHNTFGEQHVYVLPVGSEHEDNTARHGFDHSWTFPRQFHVSPFNDRSGFYTCSIIAPPHPPHALPSKGITPLPPPSVHIELRTANTRDLKLTATLRPTRVSPLSPRTLLLALARQPFSLFLSFARIVWHAAVLHYRRRLDVYARPEPRAVAAELEGMLPSDHNAVQQAPGPDGGLGVGGSIGWQPEGLLERYARCTVEDFIVRRAQEIGIVVILDSSNPEYGTKYFGGGLSDEDGIAREAKHLDIGFRSPRFFTILLSCPSAAHALLLGCDAERIFTVSDETLFLHLFSPDDSVSKSTFFLHPRRPTQVRRLRAVPPSLRHPPSLGASKVPTVHPLDASLPFFAALLNSLVVSLLLFSPGMERAMFYILRARFVQGTEPWAAWTRAESVVWKKGNRDCVDCNVDEKDGGDAECPSRVGSVRRP